MTALLSIGELASQTGLPVRTIRFYSDAASSRPAERSESGYRLYGPDALARLGLVRTLRDLGIDLATIRRVLEREVAWRTSPRRTPPRSTRRSACCACRRPCSGRSPDEAATPRSCRRCTDWPSSPTTSASGSSPTSSTTCSTASTSRRASRSGCAPRRRELPDDPAPEQVDAWIELAELVQDDGLPGDDPADERGALRPARSRGLAARPPRTCAAAAARWPSTAARRWRPASHPTRPTHARPRRDRPRLRRPRRRPRRPRVARPARRPAPGRHRRPRRALLAAAGDHQRLAARPDHRARLGVADRGPAGRLGP